MKKNFVEGKGICGLTIELNIREMIKVSDAVSAIRNGEKAKENFRKKQNDYSKIRWDKNVPDEEKERAKNAENDASKQLANIRQNTWDAFSILYGFCSTLLADYTAAEECGFKPINLDSDTL